MQGSFIHWLARNDSFVHSFVRRKTGRQPDERKQRARAYRSLTPSALGSLVPPCYVAKAAVATNGHPCWRFLRTSCDVLTIQSRTTDGHTLHSPSTLQSPLLLVIHARREIAGRIEVATAGKDNWKVEQQSLTSREVVASDQRTAWQIRDFATNTERGGGITDSPDSGV